MKLFIWLFLTWFNCSWFKQTRDFCSWIFVHHRHIFMQTFETNGVSPKWRETRDNIPLITCITFLLKYQESFIVQQIHCVADTLSSRYIVQQIHCPADTYLFLFVIPIRRVPSNETLVGGRWHCRVSLHAPYHALICRHICLESC